eukprot:1152418-Pelagomonas_calceolata.AAC.5
MYEYASSLQSFIYHPALFLVAGPVSFFCLRLPYFSQSELRGGVVIRQCYATGTPQRTSTDTHRRQPRQLPLTKPSTRFKPAACAIDQSNTVKTQGLGNNWNLHSSSMQTFARRLEEKLRHYKPSFWVAVGLVT